MSKNTPLLFSNFAKSKCSYIYMTVFTGTTTTTMFIHNKVFLKNAGNRTIRQKKLISGVSTGKIQ